MAARRAVTVDGRTLTVSNLDKELWPGEYTKGEFIAYLHDIAEYALPHFRGRPMVMTRYPDGIAGKSFYQKDLPKHAPGFIPTYDYVTEEGRTVRFPLCEETATLVWMGNMAALELHPWFSRVDSPDRPDFLAFDLDPAKPAGFDEAREAAWLIRRLLEQVGLCSWLKTSGATGLHIYVPIHARYTYDEVRGVAKLLAETVRAVNPRLITLERRVARRTGKVYIDYLQLIRGKTLIGVYMARPRPGAPVSAPLRWSELPHVKPQDFTLATIRPRLAREGDLFAPVLTEKQDIGELVKRLNSQ